MVQLVLFTESISFIYLKLDIFKAYKWFFFNMMQFELNINVLSQKQDKYKKGIFALTQHTDLVTLW